MLLRSITAALALFLLPAVASEAAVIDFTEVTPGFQGTTTLSLSNVDIVTTEGEAFDLFVFEGGVSGTGGMGGFCATLNGICTWSATIGFKLGPVSDLSFRVANFDSGDSATAAVFAGPIGSPLGVRTINGNGIVSFGDISGITALALLFTGEEAGGGLSYTDFSFTQVTNTPVVPLPAALPIMLTALGAFGVVRLRRA